jgi:hypothetical protein
MTTECINLRATFGDRFRVRYEESYYVQRGAFRPRGEDPWLQIIPCDFGHIGPWGGSTLAACTNGRGPTVTRLTALACVKVAQNGTDGVNVLFDVADFEQVAAIMRPKRRRKVSEAERQRLAALSRQYSPYRKAPFTESDSEGQGCEARGEVV